MSASEIRVVTAIVSHIEGASFEPPIAPHGISYHQALDFRRFATLSSNNPNNHRTIQGLLYVPTLTDSIAESCTSVTQSIPENAVRLEDLPPDHNYPLVAIFPWTNSECTEAFILQARMDAVRGAFVYQPGTGDTLSPNLNWRLAGDRGNYVLRWNSFPIYALADVAAEQYLRESALYSTNMSASPFGSQLEQQYDPLDYPRLLAQVQLQERRGLPFTWTTIIITLSVLLAMCILSAFAAHYMRRRYRRSLQRRIMSGEVSLASLGIKKLNVPQDKINAMPKFIYRTDQRQTRTAGSQVTTFSQSTCPVCLDDFVANETTVRELPCSHIFHPECIDIFLRDRSALCPLCKASALPKDYYPEVTDIMVRRERLARRIRAARERNESAPGLQSNTTQTATTDNTDIELGQSNTSQVTIRPSVTIPPEIAAQGHEARSSWRREQIGREQEEQYNREAEATRQADIGRPLWRRVVGRVFPGVD